MRVFLKNEKGKNKVGEILKRHGCSNNAGPLWTDDLWDKNLADKIYKNAINIWTTKIYRKYFQAFKNVKTQKILKY